jgi:hypothetical protein
MQSVIKSTQEQAVAAWINHLNQIRLDKLIADLIAQDICLEDALRELQKLKDFLGEPGSILGNPATKHGEIAENVQVYFSNARRLIEGLARNHSFEGVGRTAPEDYIRDGHAVQSKFLNGLPRTLNGNGSANGILQHITKYPDFVKNGGTYDIPKDQYEEMLRLLDLRESNPTILTRAELRILNAIDSFEKNSGLDVRKDLHPSVAKYNQVMQGTVNDTVKNEESAIKETDQKRRNEAYRKSRPSVKEGAGVTAASALLEGGVSFCLAFVKKIKEGKKPTEFTANDWQEIAGETGTSTLKGAIRGASVYTLSNFTATPANVASALVTAAFGIAAQAKALRDHKISSEDFLINSEALCLDVTVSTIASTLGQIAIPVPVLGAIIGNVAGMYMYAIAKEIGLEKEQQLIANYQAEIQSLANKLDAQYRELMTILEAQMKAFTSLLDFAFDPDVNRAFCGSIELARHTGVPEAKILKTKQDIFTYYTS